MLTLLFYVGEKGYAIDTDLVLEVIPRVLIKPLLHVPNYVLGSIMYGGALVPVVDFPFLTEGINCKDSMHSRIFILSRRKGKATPQQVGILAEKITEAVEVDESKITRSGVKIKEFPYFDGVIRSEGEIIQIIDADELIDSFEGVII